MSIAKREANLKSQNTRATGGNHFESTPLQRLHDARNERLVYRVRCRVDGAPPATQSRLAAFVIEGERVSFADSLWRATLGALLLQAVF